MKFGIYKNRLSVRVTLQIITYSKSTIETLEKVAFIANLEHISHLLLVFL